MAVSHSPKDLERAIETDDVDAAREMFVEMSGWTVLDVAIDEDDPVLYAAVVTDGAVRGVCAYVNPDLEMVVVPETDSPLFLGCPAQLIEMLDVSFSEGAIRWRRDCLARYYRGMAENARVGHPAWTAFYSHAPLGMLRANAHVAVIVGGAPKGQQELAITDGTHWKSIHVPLSELTGLEPLWPLEWSSNSSALMAMRGRASLRYLGVGPPEYRVGMLFTEFGGLLAWSGAASHCELMASLAQTAESGFSRAMLLAQLNQWQGRSATV